MCAKTVSLDNIRILREKHLPAWLGSWGSFGENGRQDPDLEAGVVRVIGKELGELCCGGRGDWGTYSEAVPPG